MKKVNNILKMISQMESNANEVKLAQHEVELSGIADKALKTFDSFRDNQLQNTYDLKTQVEDLIKKYNKKVDDTTKKFREIEKGEYLTAYTKINDMARELGVAPIEVPQLKELERKYNMNGEYVRGLQKIIVTQ
jgi:CRISPR/Cas system CMR-associated protein Cmr1 (group 7 of RAMP superfamily)